MVQPGGDTFMDRGFQRVRHWFSQWEADPISPTPGHQTFTPVNLWPTHWHLKLLPSGQRADILWDRRRWVERLASVTPNHSYCLCGLQNWRRNHQNNRRTPLPFSISLQNQNQLGQWMSLMNDVHFPANEYWNAGWRVLMHIQEGLFMKNDLNLSFYRIEMCL